MSDFYIEEELSAYFSFHDILLALIWCIWKLYRDSLHCITLSVCNTIFMYLETNVHNCNKFILFHYIIFHFNILIMAFYLVILYCYFYI